MNKGILKILVCIAVLLTGCEDLIEPAIENNRQLDPSAYLPSDSRFPFGILLNGYNRIPTNSWSFNDVATDDAVSNDQNNGYLKWQLVSGQPTIIRQASGQTVLPEYNI
ncbi:hypothetical protein ACFFJX_10530 [Pseudarcicella hirudinis]|uniref:hypothetical protein n=1 Tax=Pseudarcicella hirudinis TaxID=1079859 RepID=UPI0035EA2A2D